MLFDRKRFSKAISDSKYTSASLSEKLLENGEKISKNTIDAYRKGTIKEPPFSKINSIANILNISASSFFEQDQEIKVKYIPLIGVASCGVPNISYNDDIEYIPVNPELAREGVYALKAEGDSMLPKIKEGDVIICDKNMECSNGDIVHYTTIDGESGLKKYLISDKGVVTLMPINTNFPPIMCDVRDVKCARAFKIIGDL